ncbi:hypothetical protein ACFFP0_06345 [Rhizobium puerariae]|uniref:Uncharacterized protein n=1 Tax=Rhizobium puerariae TaxID=1585791 RepID=A0ABV6ACW8_9HYPH
MSLFSMRSFIGRSAAAASRGRIVAYTLKSMKFLDKEDNGKDRGALRMVLPRRLEKRERGRKAGMRSARVSYATQRKREIST